MLRSVTSIGTKVSSLEEIRQLFVSGRATEALHALRAFETIEASILRVRVLNRLARYGEARRECVRFGAQTDTLPVALIAESMIVFATTEFSSGREGQAAALLDEARLFVVSSANAALEAEFLYLEARLAKQFGSGDAVAERLRAVLDVFEPFGLPQRVTPTVSLGVSKARAHELLGFSRLAAGDLAGHLAHMTDALAVLSTDPLADRFVAASILANYAAAAREADPTALRRAQIVEGVAAIEWTAELATFRYSVYHSIGWIAAIEGDHLGALRAFREAARANGEPECLLRAHVDRAYLAQELGQHLMAGEEIAEALEIVRTIDWDHPTGEIFVMSAMLAQLVAQSDPSTAQELMALYARARAATNSSIFASVVEPRMQALETFALAKIALARGNRDEAVEKFEDARATWARIGCGWRAGLAAFELAKLDAGAEYVTLAQAEAETRPRSFFATSYLGSVRIAS